MSIETGLVHLTDRPPHAMQSIAIAGESAALVGECFAADGGPPLVVESEHFALLSRSEDYPRVGRVRDLPAESVDLVVLRRAWRAVTEVGEAMRMSRPAIVPGGDVIAADLDVNRLLAGPSQQYPARLLYLAEESAAERLRSSTATPGTLGAEAVRAGFKSITGVTFDDLRGSYESLAELWEGIGNRGWRGAAWVPLDRQAEVFLEVADVVAGTASAGPAVDREPWYAVVGSKW